MAAPFRGLSRLRKLTLRRNLIKSVGEEAFAGGLDSLEEVDLRGNVISTVQGRNSINYKQTNYYEECHCKNASKITCIFNMSLCMSPFLI